MTTKSFLTATIAATAFAAALVIGPPQANATPSTTVTVDGTDYPVCAAEDCSDQPNQTGVWINRQGYGFLIVGEDTYPIYRVPAPPADTIKL